MLKKIMTLGTMYFVQGLPYGFQDKFIPTYLRLAGHSYTKLSLMKLLLLPWICKAAFAPAIDMFWTKSLWLLYSLGTLTFISFLGLFISVENFTAISIWLFALNMASAIQDVTVDGLGLQILKDVEVSQGNTAQIVGYKLGALFGGGILFWIHFNLGWSGLCLSLCLLYIASILAFLSLYLDDFKTELFAYSSVHMESFLKKLGASHSVSESSDTSLIVKPQECLTVTKHRHVMDNKIRESSTLSEKYEGENKTNQEKNFLKMLFSVFHTKGTFPIASFVLFYKLGERGSLSSFPVFLIDRGVTIQQLGFWSGIIGQIFSLTGSIIGGWMISDKRRLPAVLRYICIIRSMPVLLQWIIINLWKPGLSNLVQSILFFFSIVSICTLELSAGIMTTAVFTLMMSCSLKAPVAIQGTHYTVLSSVEVAGKLIFASFAGALIDWIGLSMVYFFMFLLTLSVYFVIPDVT